MIRYWFKFDISIEDLREYPEYCGLGWGCGVTAFNLNDAKTLLQEKVFRNSPTPKITNIVESIDVSTLDRLHILPNIGITSMRGIWFPKIN